MKEKNFKRVASMLIAVITIVVTLVIPQQTVTVKAAYSPYFISEKRIAVYEKGGNEYTNWVTLSITYCNKKSEIKNLKSSNKKVKVKAEDGYVVATYPNKTLSTTITCTVKKKKLSTKLIVKKYQNPVKTFKIGSKNKASLFKENSYYYDGKTCKNQKFTVAANSGWKIMSVNIYTGNKTISKYFDYDKYAGSYSTKLSLTNSNARVSVGLYNAKEERSQYVYYYVRS